MNRFLLLLAVLLSSGRSICSKKIKISENHPYGFYVSQAILFLAAGGTVFLCNPTAVANLSAMTLGLALLYGVLLVGSQWCYTVSLQRGPTSICTMLYSFGFIFPTLSGTLFWDEPFTVFSGVGLTLTILAIIASAFSKESKKNEGKKSYLLPIFLAMTASGGLGIMQKVQQSSRVASQRDGFLILAFALATVISYGTALATKPRKETVKINVFFPLFAGICFGGANLLNTLLAGRIESAVLFPIQNIGVMIICAVFGMMLFHERITKSQGLALGLGALAILVLGFSK